ncbi:MAG TPA: hypothetical protein VJN44_12405 [Roseateles sp.]|nr:hypothetical protein [Roseateles sp.]
MAMMMMRKLWFALLFLMGGLAHEIRHPTQCHSITSRFSAAPQRRR